MPSNIRAFWWLSVSIVVYWVLQFAWFLAFPSFPHTAALAKLPQNVQIALFESARRGGIQMFITQIPFWGSLILGSAWLAAFRHVNSARWAFVAIFIVRESLPLMVYVVNFHDLDHLGFYFAHENWTDPLGYVELVLSVAAIVFVFLGNSRSWFDTSSAAKRN